MRCDGLLQPVVIVIAFDCFSVPRFSPDRPCFGDGTTARNGMMGAAVGTGHACASISCIDPGAVVVG